jgi:divalent metal cation (Fe/Co/Zn/Cd) transporter
VSSVLGDEEARFLPSEDDFNFGVPNTTRIVNLAIFINFLANVFLLIAKVVASLSSSSLSIIASLVDSCLDFLSTLIIYSVSRIVARRDWKSDYLFPVGKARLEPLGVLVFSVVMIVSFLQVIVEAVTRLADETSKHAIISLGPQAIVIMIATGTSKCGLRADGGSGGQVGVLFLESVD